MTRNVLRGRIKAGETSYGLWVTLESPTLTEMAVALGLDWVCIDMEHGHLEFSDVNAHIRAVANSGTSVIVRVSGRSLAANELMLCGFASFKARSSNSWRSLGPTVKATLNSSYRLTESGTLKYDSPFGCRARPRVLRW